MRLSSTLAPVKKPVPKKAPVGKPSVFTITVDVSGKGATLSHRNVTVNRRFHDHLRWVCRGGLIRIVWDERIAHARRDPNPFDPDGFVGPPREKIESGKVTGRTGHYKYTLYVYPEKPAGDLITLDPQVDVIDTSVPTKVDPIE